MRRGRAGHFPEKGQPVLSMAAPRTAPTCRHPEVSWWRGLLRPADTGRRDLGPPSPATRYQVCRERLAAGAATSSLARQPTGQPRGDRPPARDYPGQAGFRPVVGRNRCKPTRPRGAVGPDRHPRAILVPGLLTGFASSATGTKGTLMPIDPSMLAKSIGTLTDLQPQQDLVLTLQQAVQAAKQLFDADAVGVMLVDVDGRLRWASASDQRAQVLEDNQEVFAAGPCMEAYATG